MSSLARGEGGYLALHYNDDGVVYGGEHADKQVFIVAKGTPEEKVFRYDQLPEASAYAHQIGRPLIPAAAGNLPNLAARVLYNDPVPV